MAKIKRSESVATCLLVITKDNRVPVMQSLRFKTRVDLTITKRLTFRLFKSFVRSDDFRSICLLSVVGQNILR